VTAGLHCHPLFIEALAECVEAQVMVAGSTPPAASGASGRRSSVARCPACGRVRAPRGWGDTSEARGSTVDSEPALAPVGPAPPSAPSPTPPSLPARAA
jgi:hypothetical protein